MENDKVLFKPNEKCSCGGDIKPTCLGSPKLKCTICGREGIWDLLTNTIEIDPPIYEVREQIERKGNWISNSTQKETDQKKDWLNKYVK